MVKKNGGKDNESGAWQPRDKSIDKGLQYKHRY